MNHEFDIDPDFRDLIPQPSQDEYAQLEQCLLADGGCLSQLIVWKEGGVLLDGHTRHQICEKHSLPYSTRTLSFEDKEQAMSWVILHQLGRRNLTPAQQSYLRGKLQQEYVKQDCASPTATVAEKFAVSHSTVKRDVSLAKAVDAIGTKSPATKEKILRGEVRLNKRDAKAILDVTYDDDQEQAEEIISQIVAKRDKKHLAPPSKAVIASAQAKDAMAKLGALVRSLSTLGVYDRLRSHLTAIEKAIKNET